MSAFTRMRRGWHLGFQSLRIVLRDKSLLLFPLIPFSTAITIILSFCLIVGPDKLFWALFVVNTLEHARYLAIGYMAIAVISVFFSIGLVACARIAIDGQDSKFLDGILAGLRKFHWVVLWGLISWTIGPILNLLDHLRFTSQWVRKLTKTNWSQLSYFLLPILVNDNVNIFSAIRRSTTTTAKTWGEGAVSQLGFLWIFWFMNIPTAILIALGVYREGPWPSTLTFVVLAMVYGTIVVYQTASAVLSVVLYKYATDGSVVQGFDGAWMKEAFVRPKVYILVEDDPNDDYAPVEDVPAPDSVEPMEESGEDDEIAESMNDPEGNTESLEESNPAADTATPPSDNEVARAEEPSEVAVDDAAPSTEPDTEKP